MKTIVLKIDYDQESKNVIDHDSRICSSMVRYSFNRFQEGKKDVEIYNDLVLKFPESKCQLTNSSMRVGKSIFNRFKDKHIQFGQFKRFQRKLVSKEDYKKSRNQGIISEGIAKFKGNYFFKFDIDNEFIIYKRSRYEHFKLKITEKLSDKRKNILLLLQNLMESKSIPITIRLKEKSLYITYDESIVEKFKRFQNLYNSRILGIDLNPDYYGISIIEFDTNDNFKIIHKEVIDITKLQLESTNKIDYEIKHINYHILKLCKSFHVSKIVTEELSFVNTKPFWNKKANKKCRNQFRFAKVKNHLHTLCNIYGVQWEEVQSAYSSIQGNFIYGSNTTPDMIAAAIEIARRGYKKFTKGWMKPPFVKMERIKEVLGNQWKEELRLNYESWSTLNSKIKELKLSYRFQLNENDAVFRHSYNKKKWNILTFHSIIKE